MSEVVVTSGENLKQLIRAGNHTLVADEPADAGGGDAGPSPYDLLLAGLGACTSMTLQLYARRKQFPLEKVEVTLSQSRIHGKDCADCDTKDDYVTRISRHIKLIGPLNDEQRARLMEIARRCPVHRVLSAEISVEDSLA
jgi:putative redox protein